MHKRYVLSILMVAPLACVLTAAGSHAQQKSLKDQLVGAWTLVSATTTLPGGKPAYGSSPKGLLIFLNNGIYSTQLLSSDRIKFASNNRATGTAEENKAAVLGSVANFGTYSVNELNKTYTIQFEGSLYPNLEGAEQTRPFMIEGDQLTITNPSPTVGGPPSYLIYKRVK
jgi:Lipocalin-like domain